MAGGKIKSFAPFPPRLNFTRKGNVAFPKKESMPRSETRQCISGLLVPHPTPENGQCASGSGWVGFHGKLHTSVEVIIATTNPSRTRGRNVAEERSPLSILSDDISSKRYPELARGIQSDWPVILEFSTESHRAKIFQSSSKQSFLFPDTYTMKMNGQCHPESSGTTRTPPQPSTSMCFSGTPCCLNHDPPQPHLGPPTLKIASVFQFIWQGT